MIYLLDTHTWIWWNMNPQKLSQRVKGLIGNAEMYDELLLSAISPWEFSKLLEKKKVGISCNPEDWIKKTNENTKQRLLQISPVLK